MHSGCDTASEGNSGTRHVKRQTPHPPPPDHRIRHALNTVLGESCRSRSYDIAVVSQARSLLGRIFGHAKMETKGREKSDCEKRYVPVFNANESSQVRPGSILRVPVPRVERILGDS
jgi:hypothetical protein